MMPQEKGSVRSLGKALELLELLNRSRVPMTLQALSQASGYPKSTIHSLLATLRSYGCIRQESDGRYYLGTKLFEWGCGVSAAWEITRCARPHLERLAQQTQYTALLSCVEGSDIVVIDQRVSGTGIHVASEIGGRTPLHATSQGKLLLSRLPDATVRYLMNGQGMDPFTPHTIVDLATLTEELERRTGGTLTYENLLEATRRVDDKRRALQKLHGTRKNDPAPLSGTDALVTTQIAFYDDVPRYTAMTIQLAEECLARIAQGKGAFPVGTKRVLLTGTPVVVPNWKLHHLIETSGAVL